MYLIRLNGRQYRLSETELFALLRKRSIKQGPVEILDVPLKDDKKERSFVKTHSWSVNRNDGTLLMVPSE